MCIWDKGRSKPAYWKQSKSKVLMHHLGGAKPERQEWGKGRTTTYPSFRSSWMAPIGLVDCERDEQMHKCFSLGKGMVVLSAPQIQHYLSFSRKTCVMPSDQRVHMDRNQGFRAMGYFLDFAFHLAWECPCNIRLGKHLVWGSLTNFLK